MAKLLSALEHDDAVLLTSKNELWQSAGGPDEEAREVLLTSKMNYGKAPTRRHRTGTEYCSPQKMNYGKALGFGDSSQRSIAHLKK